MLGKEDLIKLKNLPRNAKELFNKLVTKTDKHENEISDISSQLDNKANYNTNNEISVSRLGRIINDGKGNGLSNPQGYCFDGNYHYCIYRQYNGTGNDTITKICKYDTQLNLIKSYTGNLGHGNSICKANDFLYICDTNNKIYKMTDSLELIEVINFAQNITAISFNENKFYLLGNEVVYITTNFITIDESINFELPINSGVGQGIDVYDKYIYMLRTAPNVILQYDLKGNLLYIFRLPLYADNVFKIGEVEDISLFNGNIYFNAVIVDTHNIKEINSIFYTNLKTNICGISNQPFMEFNKQSEGFIIYVDNTNINNNPLGTFSNPFPTLYEALCLVSSGYINNCVIKIKETVAILNENIFFRGTFNNVIIQALNSNCSIGSLRLGRCNATLINLTCTDVIFEYGVYNCDIGFDSLRATSSNLRLFGGKLNTTSPITLYSTTLEGVENLNVNIMDFGCHGVYKINKTLQIGEIFTSDLVEKAKIIIVSILDTNKIYSCTMTKNGLNELNIINVYNESAGAAFSSYHVTRSGKTLTFNDVRTLRLDKVATTINTPNTNCIINGLTFIL